MLATLGARADDRRSGTADMSPALQAMQRDEATNPALLSLEDGRQRFAADCSGCHRGKEGRQGSRAEESLADQKGPQALRGVAARYPAFDAALGRPLTLGQRIARCQSEYVKGPPLAPESPARLALEIYVARASLGLPIAPASDARLTPWRERGRAIFEQRFGQLDFSCAMCHERIPGKRFAGSVIPQGHPTGYPIYRLEWQGVGSLQRRIRGCMAGVRAEPFAYDSDEYLALEAYLKQRAAGMAMETPAVRP